MKNGPRVWAFCKIEFPGIQKPVQFLTQKSCFFRNPGNRGVGVIWLVWRWNLVVFAFLVSPGWLELLFACFGVWLGCLDWWCGLDWRCGFTSNRGDYI